MPPITDIASFNPATVNAVDLPVTVNGLTLTVGQGSFIIAGVTYTLAADADFLAVNRATETWLYIHLVKVIADSSIAVFVDEVIDDGIDLLYVFGGSPYKMLHRVVVAKIPANTADLVNADIERSRIIVDPS